MAAQDEPDSVLYIRLFARCAIVLGGLSSAWTIYLCLRYPVDPQAALSRLGFTLSMLFGGLVALWSLPTQRRQTIAVRRHHFSTVQLDKIMRYVLLFAAIFNVIMLPTGISSYFIAASASASFMPVKVRVDTIQLRHVPADMVDKEVILKQVFYSPELYDDLWMASGDVTIVERDGESIEPTQCQALFTVPNVYAASRTKHYIRHYKMDATIDSERFKVGELYSGWALRDGTGDVFFVRPSDKRFLEICIIASFVLIPCLYLLVRFTTRRLSKLPIARHTKTNHRSGNASE